MVNPLNYTTDATVASVEIKTFYRKGLIKFSEKRTVFNQFGQKATIPQNEGNTWEWRRASQLTKITAAATALTEGVIPSGSTLTFEKITFTPGQYGDYYAGTDKIKTMTYDPVLTIVTDAQAYQTARVVDDLIQTAVLAGSTNHYYSSAGGAAHTLRTQVVQADILNETEIRKAVRTLRRNAAKPEKGGEFIAIIHPDTWYSLMADPDIREAMIYAREGRTAGSVFTGELGTYMGVTFVESELAPVAVDGGFGGTVDVYSTLILGADYFGKVDISGQTLDRIFHDVGSGGVADPLNQKWSQGWKLMYGGKILNELNAVVMEHSNVDVA